MISVKNVRWDFTETAKTVQCEVEYKNSSTPLVFVFQGNFSFPAEGKTETGLLVALLWPAMLLGEDLHIEGKVDEELLYVANNDLQALLLTFEPRLKRIVITADERIPSRSRPVRNVATGFSAGVDSFNTLLTYAGDDVPESLRVSTLTTFNVGALGSGMKAQELFKLYGSRNKDYATKTSRSWINVNSNLDIFYREGGFKYPKTHVIRNAAVAHLLHDVVSDYCYSSSYPYADMNTKNDDMAYIEPILLSLVSTHSLKIISAGAGLSRYQKIQRVSDYADALRMLDVCVAHPQLSPGSRFANCSQCWKCSRLLFALEAMGRIDRFASVFDLSLFREKRQMLFDPS